MAPTTPATRLAEVLSSEHGERLRGLLSAVLGGNRTRTDNLLTYAHGLLAVRPGAYRLPQIAPPSRSRAAALRRILDEVDLDEAALRRALIRSTGSDPLLALVVDGCWVGEDGKGGNLICSISAATAVGATPVGWAISPSPPPLPESEILLSTIEGRVMLDLVRQCGRDYEAVYPGRFATQGTPPLVVRDPSFGCDEKLRTALRATVAEYVMALDGVVVVAPPLRENPYEPLDPTLTVAQRLPAVSSGAPPVVREVLDGSDTRHGREYIGAVARGATRAFWVARPFVATAEGMLLGHRPARRAAELVELAESVGGLDPAIRLRVSDFLHPTPRGLRRHALLASFVDAFRAGRLEAQVQS